MNQLERIHRARMAVIVDAPFFGSLLMRLRMERDDSRETFCTDGRRIAFNGDYCATLTDAEIRYALAHEVAHCALGHLFRLGGRDLERWNFATDYAINFFLNEFTEESRAAWQGPGTYTAPWTMPKGWMIDPQFARMASEDIYNRLPPEKKKNEEDQSGQSGGGSGAAGAPAKSPGEFEKPAPDEGDEDESDDDGEAGEAPGASLEEEWQVAVTQAAAAARQRGELPAGVQRMIGELLAPRVSWRQVLREFIRQQAKDDYSWSRPNRRHLSRGIILPSLHNERMGRIVFGVDTSGSIDAVTLTEFASEIQAALDECQPEAMDVIYCDAAVNGSREFLPGDAVKLEAIGGGGTRFAPVFEHIEKMDAPPVCCIYLTDLQGSFPAQEPDYPVLWAWRDRHSAKPPAIPFGEVVAVQ